ncbi:MAG: ABC transporter permease [Chloroflexota bacterium]
MILPRWTRSRFLPIWIATLLLFIVSGIVAPGTLSESSIQGMAPFAAILAVAAAGQTLVIQQRGLDLSLPGMISLTTVLVTKIPGGKDDALVLALVVTLLAAVVAGVINGLAVTRFGITPLVATLGVNALLVGTVLFLTSGTSTAAAPPQLNTFALARTLGIPNTVLVAGIVVVAIAAVIRFSVPGRRFVAVGANPVAAHAAGIPVARYLMGTYIVAALTYAVAGILLTGFLSLPGAQPGDNYLLPSIAAVVLGGTSLAGGAGSVVATSVGAVFLTQLGLVVRALGAPQSVQLILQGVIIAVGMGLRLVPWGRVRGALRRGGSGAAPHPATEGGGP